MNTFSQWNFHALCDCMTVKHRWHMREKEKATNIMIQGKRFFQPETANEMCMWTSVSLYVRRPFFSTMENVNETYFQCAEKSQATQKWRQKSTINSLCGCAQIRAGIGTRKIYFIVLSPSFDFIWIVRVKFNLFPPDIYEQIDFNSLGAGEVEKRTEFVYADRFSRTQSRPSLRRQRKIAANTQRLWHKWATYIFVWR